MSLGKTQREQIENVKAEYVYYKILRENSKEKCYVQVNTALLFIMWKVVELKRVFENQ